MLSLLAGFAGYFKRAKYGQVVECKASETVVIVIKCLMNQDVMILTLARVL